MDKNMEKLLELIGEDFMNELCFKFLMFVKIDQAYVQIMGQNLGDLIKKNSKISIKKNENENKSRSKSKKNILGFKNQDNLQFINRNRVFYSSHMNRKAGFFKNYTLWRENTIVYSQVISDNILKNKNLNNNKQNILRLMIEKIINELKRINYDDLLKNYCKIPLKYKEIKDKIKLILKKNTFTFDEDIQTEEMFNYLYEMKSEYKDVYSFLKQILKKIIKPEYLGQKNFLNLKSKLKEFIQLKRFENYTSKELISNMNVFEPEWLSNNEKINKKYKKLIYTRNKEIFLSFVGWIFNEIIIPLIRSNFYCTEKHGEGHKIFYYRKPIWMLISKLSLHKFSLDNMKEISKNEAIENSQKLNLPIAKLRILPKKNSFRPLMTFFRKIKENKTSLRQILGDVHLVLRSWKNMGKLGFSVFDNRQIYSKFEEFVNNWKENGKQKLYFATLDIKKCYDSINIEKLLTMISETNLLEDFYLINKYEALYRSKRGLKDDQKVNLSMIYNIKKRNNSVPINNLHDLNSYFKEENNYPLTILIPSEGHRAVSKEELLENLSKSLGNNLIQYGNRRFFVQKKGVPQGLNVSSVLCSFYFGEIESEIEINNKLTLVLRLTDDYLIISTKQEIVEGIIMKLKEKGKILGFELNDLKLTTNFDYSQKDKNSQTFEKNICKWIGKLIDINSLEIRPFIDSKMLMQI